MPLMRTLLAAAFALLLAAPAAHAGEVGGSDAAAIRQVIADQMAAFQRDDAAGAYAFAAPGIQMLFPTPDVFLGMVKQGYQPVYRPRDVEFRDLTDQGGAVTQDVYVVGPDGLPVIARYSMERQPDGSWKINGCTLTKSPDLSA